MEPKIKKCADTECDNEFRPFNTLQKYCSAKCLNKNKKPNLGLKKIYKPPKKESKKREIDKLKYKSQRIVFLGKPENKKCFIDGCNKEANTVEHTMGRKGYADEWARDNKITLYLDERFWKPCCLDHNLELENNPELSKKYQLSKITGKPKI